MFPKREKSAKQKSNSGGTFTWKVDKSDKHRKVKLRTSIINSKVIHEKGNIYESVLIPGEALEVVENDDEYLELENEWVAENLIDFFHELYMLFNIMLLHNHQWEEAMKNPETLDNNGYPNSVKYLWKISKDLPPQELNPSEYCKQVLRWVEKKVLDDSIFPTDEDEPFDEDFIEARARKMFQRLFRVFAIMLINPILSGIGEKNTEETRHLKTLFGRFMCFSWHWQMLKDQEISCIMQFTEPWRRKYLEKKEEFESEQFGRRFD